MVTSTEFEKRIIEALLEGLRRQGRPVSDKDMLWAINRARTITEALGRQGLFISRSQDRAPIQSRHALSQPTPEDRRKVE